MENIQPFIVEFKQKINLNNKYFYIKNINKINFKLQIKFVTGFLIKYASLQENIRLKIYVLELLLTL